jgi:hypothetical protein
MGTGMAIVGAYVLANELCLDRADPVAAFRRYQQRLAGHVRNVIRTASPGPFLAPRTRLGLSLRNMLFSLQPCKNWLIRESTKRSDVVIPEYTAGAPDREESSSRGGAKAPIEGMKPVPEKCP